MKVNTGTLVFCITFAVVSSAFGFHSPTRCAYQRKSCHHLPAYSEGESNEFSTSRRSMVQTLSLIPIFRPDSAFGAPPMTLGESDGLGARAERAMRAKPPKVLRTKLSQDFAVLLMRASYNALDQIDCIAMDQFQRDFFFVRQAEYLPYISILGPGLVQQGDLQDPYYFDFISFAQYACISRAINQEPPAVFEEQQPQEPQDEDKPTVFVAKLVKRDRQLTNDRLAPEHSKIVGEAILDRLDETFRNTTSAIPVIAPNSRPGPETIIIALQQLVKLFLLNGFAWDGDASIERNGQGPTASGTQFSITLGTPATLWSGKALQFRRANPTNSFILKAATELIRRAGYEIASSSVSYDGNQEISTLTLV